MQFPLPHALALAACLLIVTSAAVAAQAPPPPSPAAGLPEARTAIRDGRFEAALALLRPLVRRGAAGDNFRFLLGLAAVGAAEKPGIDEDTRDALLDEAIAAFRGMLVRRPDLLRVRLELGRAFFLKGEDTLARRHFEQVLAGKPPAAVALNVNHFLNRIRARKRWSVRVGMALAPDTNIGGGSDERIIYIHGLPFRRNQEELTSSGIGVSAWAGGEYQVPLKDDWRLRVGGDLYRREYRAREFDRMGLAGHVGPRWLIGRLAEVSLLLSARRHWAAGMADHRDLGLRAEASRRLSRRTTVYLDASRHERRYEERDWLDGPVTDISARVGWVATPTLRVDAGLGWGRERPETERYRHDRRWLRVGASVALPYGFTVGGAATLRWSDYEGNWFPFTADGSPRRDLTRSLRVFAHNRAFTVAGFSPQVSMVQEERTSNAQLHGYARLSGELRFVRLF